MTNPEIKIHLPYWPINPTTNKYTLFEGIRTPSRHWRHKRDAIIRPYVSRLIFWNSVLHGFILGIAWFFALATVVFLSFGSNVPWVMSLIFGYGWGVISGMLEDYLDEYFPTQRWMIEYVRHNGKVTKI